MRFSESVMSSMSSAQVRALLRAMALGLLVVGLTACVMPSGMNMDHAGHASEHGEAHGTMEHAEDTDHGGMHGGMHGDMHGDMHDADAPFDAQFIDGMIEHHQGALDMAQEVLAAGERPELLAFAQEIIDAQAHEIALMNEWRAAWYPELPPTGGMHIHMGDMEIAQDPDKPLGQRFLEAMISHHLGAIEMAVAALDEAEHAELRALAEEVIVVQQAEIEQMRTWLAEWYDVE